MSIKHQKIGLIGIAVLSFFLTTCNSQTNEFDQNLLVNKGVYNSKNADVDSVIQLLKDYHKIMFTDVYHVGRFWTDESKLDYVLPDYMLKQEFAEYNLKKIKPNLISVFYPDENCYTAQVGYSYLDTTTNSTNVFCVYTFALKRQHDSLKLFPIINTYPFKTYQNESLSLQIKDTTKQYQYIFDSLNLYNLRLAKFFGTEPMKFKCYKFSNFAELNSCIGLDVQRNYSRDEGNAYCDMYNKIIYGTSFGCYFHEVVHLYVGQLYLETHHTWINEGLATYLGGSSELSLNEHLHHLAKDLKDHPEYNLNDFLSYSYKFIAGTKKGINTNYKFTIGGLLCKIIYEKKGIKGLKVLLSSGREDENLYKTVCELLNVQKKDLNTYLRKEISIYE